MFQRWFVWGMVLGGTGLLAWFGLIGREKLLREQMELYDIPKGMKGTPISLIIAGILAMPFMGFAGIV